MKIHITTVGEFPWSRTYLEEFKSVARRDRVGQHALTDDPAEADLILFIDFQQHPDDWWMGAFHRHPLVKAHPEKICVYDERDHPRYSAPGVYVSLSRQQQLPQSQCSGCYFTLKNDLFETLGAQSPDPDLLFSFMGSLSHPVRREVVKLSHPRAVVEDTSQFNFFEDADDEDAQERVRRQKERYREVTARSKFVLCPRGVGTSSFRLFESLSLGRVPVVLSDDWVPTPGPDWPQCAVFVPQAQIPQLPRLLEERESEFETLAANARATWDAWFSPEVRFHTLIEACRALQQTDTLGICRHPRRQPAALRYLFDIRVNGLKDKLRGVIR